MAGKILEMDDPSAMGKKLGYYAITVVIGLIVHGLFILPTMYFFITKKSPIVYIRGILQALLISLATSSRWKPDLHPARAFSSVLFQYILLILLIILTVIPAPILSEFHPCLKNSTLVTEQVTNRFGHVHLIAAVLECGSGN